MKTIRSWKNIFVTKKKKKSTCSCVDMCMKKFAKQKKNIDEKNNMTIIIQYWEYILAYNLI